MTDRLKVIAGLVTKGHVTADVGTDHAYLPICLVSEGISPRVIASDVSKAAALRASAHIQEAGLSDRISVFVRDGLNGYRPFEAETLVISGMGGPLMIRILESSKETALSFKEIILSPQSEIASVRRWLYQQGFCLTDEAMVRDGDHDYFILKLCPAQEGQADVYATFDDDGQGRTIAYRYGPILMARKDPVLKDYLVREIERLDQAIACVLKGTDREVTDRKNQRLRKLESEKETACSALMSLTI